MSEDRASAQTMTNCLSALMTATASGASAGPRLVADCCRPSLAPEGVPSPPIQRLVNSRRLAPAQPAIATRTAIATGLLAIGNKSREVLNSVSIRKASALGLAINQGK